MKVERKRAEDVTILGFIGEFDAFNLPTYSQKIDALVEAGETQMVFNLRLLTFINSSALGYLLKVKKRCQELGGDLILVAPSKFIKKTLLTLGLQEVFNIYEADEDGVFAFLKPKDAKRVTLTKADGDTDEKLTGVNTIMFKVVNEEGKDLFGQNWQVGRISNLTASNLDLAWQVPPPGPKHLVPISNENVDAALHPGTRMELRFRQPFAMKAHYFELVGLATRVNRSTVDGADTVAMTAEYQTMSDEDRAALTGFVQDLKQFRDLLGKGGTQV